MIPSRLSVRLCVYHQSQNEQPVAKELMSSSILDTDSAPYEPPTVNVGPDWVEVQTGWVVSAGCYLLHNLEGTRATKVLSKEAKAELEKRVVEVALGVGTIRLDRSGTMLVRPGQFLMLEPEEGYKVYMRCRFEVAKMRVVVYPS